MRFAVPFCEVGPSAVSRSLLAECPRATNGNPTCSPSLEADIPLFTLSGRDRSVMSRSRSQDSASLLAHSSASGAETREGLFGLPAVSTSSWRWLLAILGLACALRLFGAANGALMFDESTHLAAARTIDLRPSGLHVVIHSVDHPPMSVYVVRLSAMLFGDNPSGMRVLHALVGGSTVVIVFWIAALLFGEAAALASATLLALDQFHLTWSYFAVPEVLFLAFSAAALLQYLMLRERPHGARLRWVLFGALLGMSFLAKETAVFLFAALWLAAVVDPAGRRLLRMPEWYLAHGIAVLLELPELVWNLTHVYESYLYRDHTLIEPLFMIAPRAFLLFVGELAPVLGGPFREFHLDWATQLPAPMHAPAGVLYLFVAAAALLWWRDLRVRFLLVIFLVTNAVFTLLPASAAARNYWWGSLAVLPAVLLAGWAVSRIESVTEHRGMVWGWLWRGATAAFSILLFARAVSAVRREGQAAPFISAQQRVVRALAVADSAFTAEQYGRADYMLMSALLVSGGGRDLYRALARVACGRGDQARALYFAGRLRQVSGDEPAPKPCSPPASIRSPG